MKKVNQSMKLVVQEFLADLRKNYPSVFKAGVVLFGISLIGLSQPFPTLIEHDFKAQELRFMVESQENKEIDKIDCKTIQNPVNQANCMYAKYLRSSNKTSISFATGVIVFFFYAGVLLILFSAIGYASSLNKKK